MNAKAHIFRGLVIGWRFLRRDKSAADMIDDSPAGVRMSFVAVALTFPLFIIGFALHPIWGNSDLHPVHFSLVFVLAFVLSRLVWPATITIIAPLHRKEAEMARYLVAYNWSVPYQALISIVFRAIASAADVDTGTGALFDLLGYGVIILYHMFIVQQLWGFRGRRSFMLPLSEFLIVHFVLQMTFARLMPG
jgi:hypothetical protein